MPIARTEDLVVEEIGDELLVYDKLTNIAHSLNATAARVWRACDGYTNTDVLCTKLEMDSETLEQAIDELEYTQLIVPQPQLGHTRREMTVKVAKYGAAASIPFVYSVMGPVPMAAATPTPAQCLFYSAGDCDSCAQICGCCCCCESCASVTNSPSCKLCYPSSLCNVQSAGSGCSNATLNGVPCGSTSNPYTPHCSVGGKPPKCVQPCTQDCQTGGSANCGCAGVGACPPPA